MKNRDMNQQLDLFQHFDPQFLEKQIVRLEAEITRAIRQGNLKRAAELAEEQRVLIENQIAKGEER